MNEFFHTLSVDGVIVSRRLDAESAGNVARAGLLIAVLLNQLGDQRGPTGLVAGADAGAVVAVEIFVKGNQVAPVRIALKFFRAAENRAPSVFILKKDACQPLRDFAGGFPER